MKRISLCLLLFVLTISGAWAQAVQNVELHGYIQSRFYENPDKAATFSIERVSLSVKGDLPEKAKLYLEYYYHPSASDKLVADNTASGDQYRSYLESAYADFPLKDGYLRIGKGRMLNFGITPAYGNRKTSQYGSVSELFTQDRIQGIQYCVRKDKFDGGITLNSALHMGTRSIGAYSVASSVVKHIAERDDSANNSGELNVSGKIGWVYPNFKWHLSASTTNMVDAEANKIAGYYGLAGTTDRSQDKYGFDATYQHGNLFTQFEAYKGDFSVMETKGYTFLVGYEPKNSPRAYLKYNILNNDRAPMAAQETWDTRQWILGYVYPVSNGVWIETQYERNLEVPPAGVSSVKNDLLFVELFTSM